MSTRATTPTACSSPALSSSTTPKARLLNSLLAAMATLAASIGTALSLSLSQSHVSRSLALSILFLALSISESRCPTSLLPYFSSCPTSPQIHSALMRLFRMKNIKFIYVFCIRNFTNYFDFFFLSIGLSSILMALQERVCPVTVSNALSPCALAAALNHNKGKCLHIFVRACMCACTMYMRACVCTYVRLCVLCMYAWVREI